MGMTKAEQEWSLIEGLEYCKNKRRYNKSCAGCPYVGLGCAIDAVIEMIKLQEPRVMTFEELSAINGGDIVWIEDRSLNQMIVGIKYQSPSENCYYVMLIGSKRPQPFSKELYRVNWRCWTSRPDEKRRAETPWERLN